MNFVGTGRRLASGDVGTVARSAGLETAVLLAFIEVEAAGRGFDSRNRCKILPEPHRFWAELGPGAQRDRAAAQGLAYARWGTRPYPKSMDARYDQLAKMMVVDENDALRSASWGLPQILGSNCVAAGYATAKAMVEGMMLGELQQLQAMVAFLKSEGIAALLVGKDFTKASSWEPSVRRYNGPGYKKNEYHLKCAKAYIKHSLRKDDMVVSTAQLLVRNMKGEPVMNMQKDLIAAGYSVGQDGPDGRFGAETEKAVRAFQADAGLKPVDGKFGRDSRAALVALLVNAKDDGDLPAPVWDGQEEVVDQPLPGAAALAVELAEIRLDMDKLNGRVEAIEAMFKKKESDDEQVDS